MRTQASATRSDTAARAAASMISHAQNTTAVTSYSELTSTRAYTRESTRDTQIRKARRISLSPRMILIWPKCERTGCEVLDMPQ